MANALQIDDGTKFKARWRANVTETKKGLSHLEKGMQRFARRQPIVTALSVLAGFFLIWRAARRS